MWIFMWVKGLFVWNLYINDFVLICIVLCLLHVDSQILFDFENFGKLKKIIAESYTSF